MRSLSLFTTLLAFIVILFGAYVRLSNAGLGCPDWPGCYGHLTVSQAQEAGETLEAPKAWKEMIHRYLASTLGVFILILAIGCTLKKKAHLIAWILVFLVIFQGILGMWTVTLKLHPLVVMAHLLGGFSTLSLLWWLTLQLGSSPFPQPNSRFLRRLCALALLFLVLQIALGGWTSANYAALACPDFPTCQTHLWPPMDLKAAFGVWHDFGQNYEGGVLHNEARMTIHWMHRLGALINFLFISYLALNLLRHASLNLKRMAFLLLTLVSLQIALGISNVIFFLPLPVAVAHNGMAALLLLSLITVFFNLKKEIYD